MLMLALLARKNHKAKKTTAGFTLLEILIVLFIIGLSAAVVFPNLPLIIDRVSYSNKRINLNEQINLLPHIAIRTGRDLVLSENLIKKDLINQDPSYISEELHKLALSLSYYSVNLYPATIEIPKDWSVQIPDPIIYKASGLCLGGTIRIQTNREAHNITLLPPSCQTTQKN
jgi:prepilin-type N-terminal cleavage/methylation domain-containing protein